MATWKQVILKDPITGEYLAPLGGNYSGGDANTLQGHPADYFGTKEQYDQLFQSVSEGKSLVAAAVTDKGVTTAADATFQTIANNIGKIVTASGLAVKQYMTKENVSGHYMTSVGWKATASGLTKITDCLVALVGGDIIFWAANGNFVFTDSTGNETPAIGGSAVKVNGNVFTVQPGFITKTVTVYAIFLEIDGHNAI